MKIEIEIPKPIAERLLENNWTAKQCKEIFEQFIDFILNDDYGQCYDNFDIWLEGGEFKI